VSVIKVCSYNIRRAIGIEGKKDLKQIYQVLNEINADVIALQEVEMVPGVVGISRQAHALADLLSMNYVYTTVHRLRFGSVGNAVLSRYPILKESKHLLPDSRDERICLQVDINAAGVGLSIFNVHLCLNQVSRYRHLKYLLLPIIQESEFPIILAGDFNATPSMREIRMLGTYLHDTFQHNSGLYGSTYPSDAPRVRIDYIYTDDKARCFDFAIFKSQASDHLPICASITIPNLP
jgi:endonuclease/exonuclease/phosphatase family metal-dependent hydrolase